MHLRTHVSLSRGNCTIQMIIQLFHVGQHSVCDISLSEVEQED